MRKASATALMWRVWHRAPTRKERPGCRTCDTVRSVVGDARKERFEAVARTILEPLRRYLARRTDPATADDVLAETLLVCWRRLDDLPDDPLPWSYGVARNCLANAERGVRRQQRLASKIAVVDPPAESVQGPGENERPRPGPRPRPRVGARCARRTPSCSACGRGSS